MKRLAYCGLLVSLISIIFPFALGNPKFSLSPRTSVLAQEYAPNEVIVSFKKGIQAEGVRESVDLL